MVRTKIGCGQTKSAKKHQSRGSKHGLRKNHKSIKHGGSQTVYESCFITTTGNGSDPGYETPQIVVVAIKKRLNALNWMDRAVVER